MTVTYSMACTEVLAILQYYLSESELNKIPKEKIDFLENNKDQNYKYEINKNLPLERQNISEVANSIIITLYRDYFANERQKKTLNEILIFNDKKIEKAQRNKYSSDIVFKSTINYKTNTLEDGILMIEKKEDKWYQKIFNFLRKIIRK